MVGFSLEHDLRCPYILYVVNYVSLFSVSRVHLAKNAQADHLPNTGSCS